MVQEAREQRLPDGAECFTTGGGTVQVQVEGRSGPEVGQQKHRGAAAKPLEGICTEQEVKGVLWGIKTRQM